MAAGAVWLCVSLMSLRRGEPAWKAVCKSHLRQIGLACHDYARDHGGEFPKLLDALVPDYIDSPEVFVCPEAEHQGVPGPHYVLEEGLRPGMPGDLILAYGRSLANHAGRGRAALHVDGSVHWRPAGAARTADGEDPAFRAQLFTQREAVRKRRTAGAKKDDIPGVSGKPGASE